MQANQLGDLLLERSRGNNSVEYTLDELGRVKSALVVTAGAVDSAEIATTS